MPIFAFLATFSSIHKKYNILPLIYKEIGKELFTDGGVDALENFFFVITNRIEGEINKSPAPFRSLWNGLSDEWKY